MDVTTDRPFEQRLKHQPRWKLDDTTKSLFQLALGAYMTLRCTQRELDRLPLWRVVIRRRLQHNLAPETATFQAFCQALSYAHYLTVQYTIPGSSPAAKKYDTGLMHPAEAWAENVQAYHEAGWHNQPMG